MNTSLVRTTLAVALALTLTGCTTPGEQTPLQPPETTPGGGAAGIVAAPGIYELEDGTVQALGTLEYRDLEGGFWAVVNGLPDEQVDGEAPVVAVIANAEDLGVDLQSLSGKYVSVTGKRLEGASIRMAGPEIEAESIEEVGDTAVE